MQTINSITDKELPVFITETGWDQTLSSDSQVGEYFKQAFETAWNDEYVVAVTPFLLNSGPGPFEKFSFLKSDGSKNEIFKAIYSIKKITGSPVLNSSPKIESEEITNLPSVRFPNN